jgi:hypothetical protein
VRVSGGQTPPAHCSTEVTTYNLQNEDREMSKKIERRWHNLHEVMCTYTIIKPNGGAIRSSGSPESPRETITAMAKEYKNGNYYTGYITAQSIGFLETLIEPRPMKISPQLLETLIEYFEI